MFKSKLVLTTIAICVLVSSFSTGIILGKLYEKPKIEKVTAVITSTPTPTLIQLNMYKIYDLVNEYRESKDLTKLVFDPSMCEFASIRLKQTYTDWSHNGFLPDAKKAYGYNIYIGENLAKGYSSEEETLSNWIASPEHLENMEKPIYTRTCIETDNFQNETYAVQEFASN